MSVLLYLLTYCRSGRSGGGRGRTSLLGGHVDDDDPLDPSSRFDGTPTCDRQTDRQTDGQTRGWRRPGRPARRWDGLSPSARRLHVSSTYSVLFLQTVLIIISSSIPSPSHSFIPRLKLPFSANPPPRCLPFLLRDWLDGLPALFIDTSEHIRFLLFSFFSVFHLVVVGSVR